MNALAATVTDDAEGRILDALLARGRLKELLIGSTADRFLRRSPVDVLVVKPTD